MRCARRRSAGKSAWWKLGTRKALVLWQRRVRRLRRPIPGAPCSTSAGPTGGSCARPSRARARRSLSPLPDDAASGAASSALRGAGIESLWSHQAEALQAAWDGPTIVTTGTASGKSLCFNMPALDVLCRDAKARALYLYPTKALAQDQARAINAFGLTKQVRPAIYDGDTPRRAAHADPPAREPHPHEPRHAAHGDPAPPPPVGRLLLEPRGRRRRRGARLPRRVRLARRQRAAAAAADRQRLRHRAALPARQRDDRQPGRARRAADGPGGDRARRPRRRAGRAARDRDVEPAADRRGARHARVVARRGGRDRRRARAARARARSASSSRARRSSSSRGWSASPTRSSRTSSSPTAPATRPSSAASSRGGSMRGELLAVITTDALELGIDIGALDAAVVVTFPGTVASLRQMWGRAGRRGRGLAVYVAGEDALDQFFCRHPDEFLDRPVEAAILDHENEPIHLAHLLCAAHEGPLERVGRRDARAALGGARAGAGRDGRARRARRRRTCCATPRTIRRRASRCARRRRTPTRSSTSSNGELLGTVESARAHTTVHDGADLPAPGALRTSSTRLEIETRRALVEPFSGDFYTQPKKETMTEIEALLDRRDDVRRARSRSAGSASPSRCSPTSARRSPTTRSSTCRASTCPQTTFQTQALWYELHDDLLADDFPLEVLLGSLHAAEHAQIAVLPLLAMCDRWDIGGLSTNYHPQTGRPTIFIYDGHPGGVGITRQGFLRVRDARRRRAPAHLRVRLQGRLPVVRAVAEVRQPQRAAGEGGGAGAAWRGCSSAERRAAERARRRAGRRASGRRCRRCPRRRSFGVSAACRASPAIATDAVARRPSRAAATSRRGRVREARARAGRRP